MSKAAIAVDIYKAEALLGAESLRKRCIARYKSELAMGDAGAATYFQNTKKKIEAGGLVIPTAPPAPAAQPAAIQVVAETPLWNRCDLDENGVVLVVEGYTTEEEAVAAQSEKGGVVANEPQVINVGDCIK